MQVNKISMIYKTKRVLFGQNFIKTITVKAANVYTQQDHRYTESCWDEKWKQPIAFWLMQNIARWLWSDPVHTPLNLGYICILTPWSKKTDAMTMGEMHRYINLLSSFEFILAGLCILGQHRAWPSHFVATEYVDWQM